MKMKDNLESLEVGRSAVITDLAGNPEFVSRATSLGFCPGTSVSMLRKTKGYPIIVYLNDTQIAIDKKEAKQVMIDEQI